jgi:hypothetical protein
MHGDIQDEKSIIITRKDYDNYSKNNYFFLNKFSLDLSHKSCIFIGTSVNDFNLNKILSEVSLLVDEGDKPTHYIFFLKEKEEKIQEYRTKELLNRFNIDTIFLNN